MAATAFSTRPSLPVGCFWLAAVAAAATGTRARSALGRLRFTTGRRDLAFWAAARLLFEMWGFMAGLQVHHRDNRCLHHLKPRQSRSGWEPDPAPPARPQQCVLVGRSPVQMTDLWLLRPVACCKCEPLQASPAYRIGG